MAKKIGVNCIMIGHSLRYSSGVAEGSVRTEGRCTFLIGWSLCCEADMAVHYLDRPSSRKQ